MPTKNLPALLSVLLFLLVGTILFFKEPKRVDFSTDVKPILNKHCISCHGGVKKNGGFSVLFEEEAFAVTESGQPAIIPGRPGQSEIIRRLYESDPEMRMPYHRPALSPEEIETLKNWIHQGAAWGKHWAYVTVEKPEVPSPSLRSFASILGKSPISTIDHFVFQKQIENGLSPSPEEESLRLLRRLALDITGLPPSEKLVADWNGGKLTYDQAVDQLLSLPTYGEKWATWWLDMARYADTKGYERDVSRTMWPYRDWVIKSLNDDMPFDRFTVEQLAGDLLPNPTEEQLIATAFHRNTMNNDEGGTEDEEFRVAAVLDRVNTTFEVWQSTTMACVQCHSHPYDPFKHEEYFQIKAFFNNSRDEDTHDEEPKLRLYSEEEKAQVQKIKTWVAQNSNNEEALAKANFLTYLEPKYHAHLCEDFVNAELIDTKWLGMWHNGTTYLRNVDTQNSDQLLLNYWADIDGTKMEIRKGGPEGEILSEFTIDKTEGRITRAIPFKEIKGNTDLFITASNPKAKPQLSTSAIVWFAFIKSLPGKDKPEYLSIEQQWKDLLATKPVTLPIMIENPDFMKRKTNVFERGNWMLLGEEVSPKTPEALNNWNPEWPKNRLGLAYWMVDKENPLTARTLVNRVWAQIFGRGLVNTLEDMGTQSDLPSHPELLDHLAWKLMHEYNWSIKSLIKEILTSHTYRQSSKISPRLHEKDPENKWYARGPRFRLSAEQVRDQALVVSGLISDKMYGIGVMPHQPDGIWQTVYNGESWKTSEGEDQYRRSVYTFLKRTSPYPSFISFDAGSREVCISKRIVTNTPLQALATLNDPVYIEAALKLGEKMSQETNKDPGTVIAETYEKMMLVTISESKKKSLLNLYQEALTNYRSKPEELKEFLQDKKVEGNPELAAYTLVANAMLNLDEFLTKS
jgi:hypothetical protein